MGVDRRRVLMERFAVMTERRYATQTKELI